jgi:hypothetical protein
LVIAGSRESRSALVTPPMQPFADWRNAANAALHTRPRLDVSVLSGRWRRRRKHMADCRLLPCDGSEAMSMRTWVAAWI